MLEARPWGLFQHKAHSREPSREDLWLQGVGMAEGEVTWCRPDPAGGEVPRGRYSRGTEEGVADGVNLSVATRRRGQGRPL